MANKKLTKEQEYEISVLMNNNKMLEKTKSEAEKKGNEFAIRQIDEAQKEVMEHIKMIDPTYEENGTSLSTNKKKKAQQDNLFDTDMSIFEMLEDNAAAREAEETVTKEVVREELKVDEVEYADDDIKQSESTIANSTTFSNFDGNAQYDVIQLPSNGQCYRNRLDRVPVAYLTAYDENIITSPNLYKDGLVIDFLLKNKVVNKDINVDDLVSGDADAIILFLRATSYGTDFPIVVTDPETGEQFETMVDLSTFKPKDFKLVGDENGWFEYETPIGKDKVKFRYLTRKQEKQLKKVTELETVGTKAHMLDSEKETLLAALVGDKFVTDAERKSIEAAAKAIDGWSKRLKEANSSQFTKIMTNSMLMQVVSVNGNTDREYIRKYINSMHARDSLMLRKYINENRPGIDFNFEVERPESLGGGSFTTFLNWDDSIFYNIADI